MIDLCRVFADRLADEYGIHVNPVDLVADGKMRHATPEGERPRSKKLAYKIHDDDRPVGWFEHYPTSQKASIKLSDAPVMSDAERAESRRRWAQQRAREEAEQAARYDERAAYAARLWAAAVPFNRHPYLDAKGIDAPGSVRLLEELQMGEFLSDPERRDIERGVLLVPVYSGPGVLRSLQAITREPRKLNLAGGQQGGCYHPIKGSDPSRILVCEGYATGVSLHAATGHSVVCAMSAKNLPAVARIVAAQAKGREIVICADNDHRTQAERGWNPGIDAGEDAAKAIGARVVWPTGCTGTDWDDWLREGGSVDVLRRIIAGEVDPPPGEGIEAPEGTDVEAGQVGRVVEPASLPAPVASTAFEVMPRVRADLDATVDRDQNLPAKYSEDNVAIAFAQQAEALFRFVPKMGRWMVWDGARWQEDETGVHLENVRIMCRAVCDLIRRDADEFNTEAKQNRAIAKYGERRTIANIESLARTDRRLVVRTDQWDSDPWLLNTPGGVVDLRTGVLRPARQGDYMTKITEVAPAGDCPTWLRFLETATNGDAELIGFLQRMAGYCLTGSTRDHALFFVYGTGGNGKGTFLNTIQWVMGDYSRSAPADMFTERKNDAHTTELARLMGARLVAAQETEEGKRWAEAKIKALTGGDPVTARFMRQDDFEFIPQFKLVMTGNHKPGLRNVDEAIKRRLHLIPFTVTIPAEKRDTALAEKLRAEAGGILAWAIEGCQQWLAGGLKPPAAVLAATAEYLEQQDAIGVWLEECCETHPHWSAKSSDLYASYKAHSERSGEFALPMKRWVAAMEGKGFTSKKAKAGMIYSGVKVKLDEDEYRNRF